MNVFGKRVFADVIKVNIEMKSYWIEVVPKSNESPYKRQKRTHRTA